VRDIYVTAVDGSGTWPLVEHPANDLFPQWAPDGSRVFFASDRTGALGLWMARVADGRAIGEPEVISSDMGRMNPLGFTRAGAFYYHLRTGLVDAYTVAIDPQTEGIAARPDPVAPNYIGSNVSSAWSPDGQEVAYVSIRSIARADRFSRTLSIRNLETGEERDLWPALAFFLMPQWSLDGRSILVRGNDLDGRCCLQQVDVASRRVTHIPSPIARPPATTNGSLVTRSYSRETETIVSHDLFAGTEATIVDIHVLGLDRFSAAAAWTSV
jgi:Tol biopolymer transport system component